MTPLKSQLTVNNMLRIYDTKERKNQLDVAKTKTAYESFLIDDVINMGINIDLDMALKQKYYFEKKSVDKKNKSLPYRSNCANGFWAYFGNIL